MAFSDAQANCQIIFGKDPLFIQLGGTVTKGDAVGKSSGEWVRALATTANVVQMRCVAGEDGVTGQFITAYFGVTIVGGDRFSGATVGGAIYVAEGTSNGKYTATAPSDTGDATTIVGYALSAVELVLIPNYNPDTTKA